MRQAAPTSPTALAALEQLRGHEERSIELLGDTPGRTLQCADLPG